MQISNKIWERSQGDQNYNQTFTLPWKENSPWMGKSVGKSITGLIAGKKKYCFCKRISAYIFQEQKWQEKQLQRITQ